MIKIDPNTKESQLKDAIAGIERSIQKGEKLESDFDIKFDLLPIQNYKGFKIRRMKSADGTVIATAKKYTSTLYPKPYVMFQTRWGTEHEVGKQIRQYIDLYRKSAR